MRLIDADELIEEIKSMRVWLGGKDIFQNEAKESIVQLIEDEPTAYDIDKVVEDLEGLVIPIDKKQTRIPLDKAIEIVRQGLKDQKGE